VGCRHDGFWLERVKAKFCFNSEDFFACSVDEVGR
jgi:hypothetical protein